MSSCAGAESTGACVRDGVANPEHAEDDRERGAEDDRRDADDEADENDGDADGEADRPEALARCLWSVVGILGHSLLSIA